MARNRPARGQEVRDGLLRGHFRSGKTYVPPIMALQDIMLSDWITDDLPDLLWPLTLVATKRERGAFVMSQAQQAIVAALGREKIAGHGASFDGRLSSIENITDSRDVILGTLIAHRLSSELFSPQVVGVLRLYGEHLPGRWLFNRLAEPADALDEEQAINLLARAIVDVAGDRHLNALVKAAPFGWEMMMGRLHMPEGVGDELIDYPMVPENFEKADAFILSAFLMTKGVRSDDVIEGRRSWARAFWNLNWGLTECLPEEDASDEGHPHDTNNGEGGDDSDSMEEATEKASGSAFPNSDPRAEPIEAAFAVFDSFLQSTIDPTAPIDLYSPARFEILTGFVARAYRSVIGILRAPHLWSGEQAAPVMRSLLEARIVATWMLAQDAPDWFERYQAYGRGKRKLHREIVNDLVDRLGDPVPPELAALADKLGERTGGAHESMFQEVSVDSTFAGKNLRTMAAEVGLSHEYRFGFQIESGVTHGEWWAIEEYVMQRCANPLHRFHLLPSFRSAYPSTIAFPVVLLSAFEALVDVAEEGLLGAKERGSKVGDA